MEIITSQLSIKDTGAILYSQECHVDDFGGMGGCTIEGPREQFTWACGAQ